MIIEPGIFDAAHKAGIPHITDMNGDGKIDQSDLGLALKAKAGAKAVVAEIKPATK